jgi:hypothetical protein
MSAPTVPEVKAINGAVLLDSIRGIFGKYVVFPSAEAHDAVVLWTAATHAQPAWEHAPRLAVISPEKRCGKSRLMDVCEALCNQPLVTVNASPAAVVRSITEDPPTLMLDEADTIFGTKKSAEQNEDIRGLLNAGHQRNRPYLRWDMAARQAEYCPTFAMAVLAGIGNLPDTIMDRAVKILMRRRAPGEIVAPYRTGRDGPVLKSYRDELHEFVRGHLDELRDAVPVMPVEDRDADTWEPLFAVADLVGGDWPERAKAACLALSGEDPDEGRLSTRLLSDLRSVWKNHEDHLFTQTIIHRLVKIEEAPWSALGRGGSAIDARALANLLRPYGVKPRTVKEEPGKKAPTQKGYYLGDLLDIWSRYVTTSDTPETPDT